MQRHAVDAVRLPVREREVLRPLARRGALECIEVHITERVCVSVCECVRACVCVCVCVYLR